MALAEDKHRKLSGEKEQLAGRLSEFISLQSELKEAITDRDDTIDQFKQKMVLLENDKKFMQKSYKALAEKIKRIETQHILIPRNKKEDIVVEEVQEDLLVK